MAAATTSKPPDSYDGQLNDNAEQLLRPVTVQQILGARRGHSAAKLAIDGNEVVHVTVVASVVEVDNSDSTRCDFQLEDGTRGRILGRKWLEENQMENVDVNAIMPCTYVRIIGKLKKYKRGRNSLDIVSIRKVEDYHELYFHLLDAMVTTLTYERGPPPRSIFSSEFSVSSTDSHDPIEQPSASQIQQDIFDTSFAMHAMHDSLPASPRPAVAHAFPPLNDRTEMQSVLSDSDVDEIIGSQDEDIPWPILLKRDKGKGRAISTANGDSPQSPLLSPTLKTGITGRSTLSALLSPELVTISVDRSISATNGGPLPPLAPSPLPHAFNTFTERKQDPYSDLSILARRIILIMFELERSPPPIYRTAEVNTRYQGIDVGTIMSRMYSLDSNLTPKELDDEITFLIDEGYVYTTVDDHHIAITQIH